jgi:hypothetical protein
VKTFFFDVGNQPSKKVRNAYCLADPAMAVIIVSRLMVPMHQPAPVSIRGVKGKRAR